MAKQPKVPKPRVQGVTVANPGRPAQCWRVSKTLDGQRYTETSPIKRGDFLSERDWVKASERWYAQWLDNILSGAVFTQRPLRSFSEACDLYVINRAKGKASAAEICRLLAYACEFMGNLDISKVHQDCQGYNRMLQSLPGRKAQTINNYTRAISAVLNYCTRYRDEQGLTWLQTAPVFTLLSNQDQRLPKVLTWDEQDLMLNSLPDHLRFISLFILNTGLRSTEALSLTNRDLTLREQQEPSFALIQRAKNGLRLPVVLNGTAETVIKAQPNLAGLPEVFHFRGKPLRGGLSNTGWRKMREKTGLDVRVHDLRHTYGHRLLEAGCPEEIRRIMMGHKGSTMTQHYSQTSLETMLKYAEAASKSTGAVTPYLRVSE